MSFVGLDPDRAGELARHLDEAAADLYAHAGTIAGLLSQAGISSSQAPAEIRDVAGWAAYRSRDLRRRIAQVVAADHLGAGPTVPGFRFATQRDATSAADHAADKLSALLAKGNARAAHAELRSIAPYLADRRFAAELFKRLGPKGTFEVLAAAKGSAGLVALGRTLGSGVVSDRFLDGIIEAAQKRAAALDAYMHPWGSVSQRDRAAEALDEYTHDSVGPRGGYTFLQSVAPLAPYLEAGTRVAIIGGAVVLVTAAGACAALSDGLCIGPQAALIDQGAVVFSDGAPALPDGLATLPMGFDDEAEFTGFAEEWRTGLDDAGWIRDTTLVRGSAATGVSYRTEEPFDASSSDLDLAIAGDDIFATAQRFGIELRGGGTRTVPLDDLQLERLGLTALRDRLSDLAGREVTFMIYRSVDDAVNRGPTIVVRNR